MKRMILTIALTLALAAPAQAAPLCRDAKPGAARFGTHIVRALGLDGGTLRFHDCGRWRGRADRLWFRVSYRDSDLGYTSWWIRATWHGDYMHYFTQGYNVAVPLDMWWLLDDPDNVA